MSTVTPSETTIENLQEQARRHLWMHFSRMGGYSDEHEIPIITRGDGAYVYDAHGKRYLDGLSGLFCVNAGPGRIELAEAAARQFEELDFFVIWSYAHPRAIELASNSGRPRLVLRGVADAERTASAGVTFAELSGNVAPAPASPTTQPSQMGALDKLLAAFLAKQGEQQAATPVRWPVQIIRGNNESTIFYELQPGANPANGTSMATHERGAESADAKGSDKTNGVR